MSKLYVGVGVSRKGVGNSARLGVEHAGLGGVVAGGHRKGTVSQRFGNRVRGCVSLQRQRRVQSAQTVGTDYGHICESTESPHMDCAAVPAIATGISRSQRRISTSFASNNSFCLMRTSVSTFPEHRDTDRKVEAGSYQQGGTDNSPYVRITSFTTSGHVTR